MRNKQRPGRPRAEDQKPMLTAKIVQAYSETGSLEKTASRCGIAPNTVKAILHRNPEDFVAVKKALATRMLIAADEATRIAAERIEECSSPQAAVVAGIFTQRGSELLQQTPSSPTINAELIFRLQCQLEADRNALAAIRASIARSKAASVDGRDGQPAEDHATETSRAQAAQKQERSEAG
jgi:hypothetical protein